MDLGDRLKTERAQRHWSQYDLARESGVSQSAIAKIENGTRRRISGDILRKLATAFGMSLDTLTTGAPAPDLSQPPIDLLQTAGYSEEIIARVVESWQRQPVSFRSEVLTRAQRRLERMQQRAAELAEDEHLLAAALHIVPLIF